MKYSSVTSYIRNVHMPTEACEVEEDVWAPRVCQTIQHCVDVMIKTTLRLLDTGLTLITDEDNAKISNLRWLLCCLKQISLAHISMA